MRAAAKANPSLLSLGSSFRRDSFKYLSAAMIGAGVKVRLSGNAQPSSKTRTGSINSHTVDANLTSEGLPNIKRASAVSRYCFVSKGDGEVLSNSSFLRVLWILLFRISSKGRDHESDPNG
jgi:hypothetical protein